MSKKLIRCHTTDPKSIFDCVFNEPIEVNPYSEIALQSASFSMANQFLNIDASNDELTFQVDDSSQRTVRITNDTYTKYNATRMLEALTKSMNKVLNINIGKEHGSEISVSITKDTRVKFDMKYSIQNVISSQGQDLPMFYADDTLTIPTRRNDIFLTDNSDMATEGDVYTNYILGTVPFTKGCGNFVFKLSNYISGGTEEIVGTMGLVSKETFDKYKGGSELIVLSDFHYFFQIPGNGFADPDYGKTLTENSHISMELTDGLLRFREYKNDNSEQDLKTFASPLIDNFYDVDLYPVLIINADKDFFKIKDLKYTPTPFVSSSLLNTEKQIDAITSTVPIPTGSTATVYNLTFGSISLRDYLGFTQLIQNPLLTVSRERTFTADRIFSNVTSADNYLVEMLNMKLDSYDSFTRDNVGGGRKNILAPIPISEQIVDNETGLVQFSPPEMLFISLNNEFKLNIRNIRMRLVDTQYSEVNNAGFASLNIVIRDSR